VSGHGNESVSFWSICEREMLATYILAHTFQHIFFDRLIVIWNPHDLVGPM